MDQILSTTPFGGRSLTPAMRRAEVTLKSCKDEPVAHKWRLWRAIAEAKDKIGVSDRALAVLNALLSFHPETTLTTTSQLIVFPSNEELSIRAHGMAPATLRRHLAALVELGLIIRRDSPNGKRYARKTRDGEITQAFGFDLSILVTRAAEFEALAESVRKARDDRAALRERISILKRDVSKWLEALAEGRGGVVDISLHERFISLAGTLPKKAEIPSFEKRERELAALLCEVQGVLEIESKSQIMSANESHIERHLIQNSNPDSSESEPAFRNVEGDEIEPQKLATSEGKQAFPLSIVLKACPDITMYARNGIATWSQLVSTADVARSALGVSPDAWRSACVAMGDHQAAIVVSSLLQRSERIRSPGGYLRSLTGKAREGSFSVGPLLMALLNEQLNTNRKVSEPLGRRQPPTPSRPPSMRT